MIRQDRVLSIVFLPLLFLALTLQLGPGKTKWIAFVSASIVSVAGLLVLMRMNSKRGNKHND